MYRYKELEKKIGVKFKNKDIVDKVFVHKSYVNEHRAKGLECNERLEFLGDAVLELVVTEYLFKKYPACAEGEMTSLRSALVKGKHLAEIAAELNLGAYLYLSKGEEKGGGRNKSYILANVFEALIGGIYLDRGYNVAHKLINKLIILRLSEIVEKGLHVDPKSHFQEIAQERLDVTPEYHLVAETGPDHSKIFTMGAYLKNKLVAKGNGSSKQKAESVAAEKALKKMKWDKDGAEGEI